MPLIGIIADSGAMVQATTPTPTVAQTPQPPPDALARTVASDQNVFFSTAPPQVAPTVPPPDALSRVITSGADVFTSPIDQPLDAIGRVVESGADVFVAMPPGPLDALGRVVASGADVFFGGSEKQQLPTGLNEGDLPDLGGFQLLAAESLSGMAFVNFVRTGCANRRIHDLAVFSNAMAEGIHGGIGDFGTSYGPWQLHKGGALPAKYSKLPDANDSINAWAWSPSGINYALDAMAKTSAVGKRGHAAVDALVAEFERPANLSYEQGLREQIYDQLAAMSDPYSFLAKQASGAAGQSSEPPPPIVSTKKSGVGAVGRWRDLMDVFGNDFPATRAKVKAASDDLIGVFK